jgi:hypothetical protein
MSSYVKATNFATKDTLPTGDSNKIIKGTEIDNEYNAIAGAISSKADLASPTFTGTPAAPTATSGSNTTQIATTAYVKGEVDTAVDTAVAALGTLSTQDADAVSITGGDISATDITTGTINSLTTTSLGTNAYGTKTVSSSTPTGGANGDLWYQV